MNYKLIGEFKFRVHASGARGELDACERAL